MSARTRSKRRKPLYTATLVSETHWDRAWYLTFEEFRILLVRLIDDLLAILERDPGFKTFTLDGQTVALEDYLEIRPEREETLRKHIRSGRIMVGPWYVLPDMFLEGPEAMVRNLMLGMRTSRRFGHTMRCAYTPDPFGHPAQLPQILREMGLDNFIFSRGTVPELEKIGTEFRWVGADGESSVLAVWQKNWYGNAAALGYAGTYAPRLYPLAAPFSMDLALQKLGEETRKLAGAASTRNVLLNNGVDHNEAQPEIPRIIAEANRTLKEITLEDGRRVRLRITHGTFEDYVRRVRKSRPRLPAYRGELRALGHPKMLNGTLSSRMALKQANASAQHLLVHCAEALSGLAWYLVREPVPHAVLWQAWRYVLKSHPHDDICGCSTDQVHREGMARFESARQIGEVVTRDSATAVIRRIDTKALPEGQPLVVFNPLPWKRTDMAAVQVEIPAGQMPAGRMLGTKRLALQDARGRAVPCQLIEHTHELANKGGRERITLAIGDRVSGCGYKTYVMMSGGPVGRPAVRTGARWMQNERLRVTIRANGTLTVRDLETGTRLDGVNLFEDVEDTGDEYNYCPAARHERTTTRSLRPSVRCLVRGPLVARFLISYSWPVPQELTPDRRGRSRSKTRLRLRTTVTLAAGSDRIEILTELENTARDHRLRVLFPTPVRATHSEADGHFGVDRRPVLSRLPKDFPPGAEQTHPQQAFVAVNDARSGVAVLSRGLPEYEVLREKGTGNATIAVTLLRSVGWLSRDDLVTRPKLAGPAIPTPEAQCPGTHAFEYALRLHRGDCTKAGTHRAAREFSVPVRAWTAGRHTGVLPAEQSLLALEPAMLAFSCLKKAERGNSLILRFYNPGERPLTARVKLARKPASVRRVDMAERPVRGGRVRLDGTTASVVVKPKKIISLSIR